MIYISQPFIYIATDTHSFTRRTNTFEVHGGGGRGGGGVGGRGRGRRARSLNRNMHYEGGGGGGGRGQQPHAAPMGNGYDDEGQRERRLGRIGD